MQHTAPPLPVAAVQANPHFERIGGSPGVDRLVDAFYRRMDTLPEAAAVRAMHPPQLAGAASMLKLFLAEWMGGPKAFSAQHGPARLRQRHIKFPIDESARDAWMLCMRGALEEVVPDAGFRDELTQAFFKTADFLRNDTGGSHEHHHR